MIVVLMLVCCSVSKEGNTVNDRIYATVNNIHLTESDLKDLVPEGVYDKLTIEYKQEIIKEWVNNELIYQEALQRNIDKDPKIERLLYNSKRNLLSNELLERIYSDIGDPDEEELKSYYKEHEDYFILNSNEYRIRYALFDNRKDAQDFWRAVKQGESFSELAKTDSKDPSFQTGGDIGVINEEMIEPAIWNAIENTYNKLGLVKISDPFSVMDGWSCLIVDEVYEKDTVKPFGIVRDQVIDMYLVEKREEARTVFIDELAKKANIKYESAQ
ncbi:MAG: peptidylprolyl isomerase [Candidatus Latescibacteria bacterium]|nr:peptidylprolyl isomerase [Candidatus Latescibacterota bacterium]